MSFLRLDLPHPWLHKLALDIAYFWVLEYVLLPDLEQVRYFVGDNFKPI